MPHDHDHDPDNSLDPMTARVMALETILTERRMPVYLVLNEGVWRVRRLTDLLFRVPLIDARSEVMGPFEPPADAALLPEFIAGLRATLVKRLADLRSGETPPA